MTTTRYATKKSNGKVYIILSQSVGKSSPQKEWDHSTGTYHPTKTYEGNRFAGQEIVTFQAINPKTGEGWQKLTTALASDFRPINEAVDTIPARKPSGQPPVTVGQMIDAGLMTPAPRPVRISDLGGQDTTTYVANSEADCQDSTDASAYREAVKRNDVITMGKVIAEPLPASDINTRSNKHRALFETVADKANWKLPTNAKTCATRAEAQALADAITWFVGGAEINHDNTVLSRGYYFYIGA